MAEARHAVPGPPWSLTGDRGVVNDKTSIFLNHFFDFHPAPPQPGDGAWRGSAGLRLGRGQGERLLEPHEERRLLVHVGGVALELQDQHAPPAPLDDEIDGDRRRAVLGLLLPARGQGLQPFPAAPGGLAPGFLLAVHIEVIGDGPEDGRLAVIRRGQEAVAQREHDAVVVRRFPIDRPRRAVAAELGSRRDAEDEGGAAQDVRLPAFAAQQQAEKALLDAPRGNRATARDDLAKAEEKLRRAGAEMAGRMRATNAAVKAAADRAAVVYHLEPPKKDFNDDPERRHDLQSWNPRFSRMEYYDAGQRRWRLETADERAREIRKWTRIADRRSSIMGDTVEAGRANAVADALAVQVQVVVNQHLTWQDIKTNPAYRQWLDVDLPAFARSGPEADRGEFDPEAEGLRRIHESERALDDRLLAEGRDRLLDAARAVAEGDYRKRAHERQIAQAAQCGMTVDDSWELEFHSIPGARVLPKGLDGDSFRASLLLVWACGSPKDAPPCNDSMGALARRWSDARFRDSLRLRRGSAPGFNLCVNFIVHHMASPTGYQDVKKAVLLWQQELNGGGSQGERPGPPTPGQTPSPRPPRERDDPAQPRPVVPPCLQREGGRCIRW